MRLSPIRPTDFSNIPLNNKRNYEMAKEGYGASPLRLTEFNERRFPDSQFSHRKTFELLSYSSWNGHGFLFPFLCRARMSLLRRTRFSPTWFRALLRKRVWKGEERLFVLS